LGLVGCGKEASPPPVIIISVDTLRADRLSAYGYEGVETPALDQLSQDAVLFENAISHCPLTLPSHASLLTGELPVVHGVRDNLGYRLDSAAHPLLPALLSPAGYTSGAAVSSYVLRGETGLAPAFDWYDDEIQPRAGLTLDRLERRGEETLGKALQWIDGEKDSPFFLFVHLFEPHDPYEAPPPWNSQGADSYDGEVAYTDFLVGRFLDELRSRDLYDRSLVIFLSDHGEGLGDHGEARHGLLLYRSTLHIPLLVKLPDGERGGTRVEAPAQLVDVLPTVLDVAGVSIPEGLPGRSLVSPSFDSPSEKVRRIYSETYYGRLHYGWSELRSLMNERFHYIESPNPELFDLVSDPGQQRNVLTEERRAYAELRQALEAYPSDLAAPEEADPEVMARLAALGYLTAPAPQEGPRPDPKENLQLLEDIQSALELQAAGRLEEAADQLQALQREHPEVQDVYLLLGPVLRRLGRLDEAIAVGLEGQRRLPTLAPLVSLELARGYLAAGDWEAAAGAARAGATANRSQSHELLARIAQAQGDLQTSVEEADRALEASGVPRADLLVLRARLHMSLQEEGLDENGAALSLLSQAHELVTAGKALPVLGLDADRGDLLARSDRPAEAEQAFREEIAHFPGNLQAYGRYAFLLATQRRFDEIEPLFEALAAARPDPRSYIFAADTLERLGNAEAAVRWRQRAL